MATGRIYISGPMTGHPLWNFPAFFGHEQALRQQGWDVVNPARIDEEQGDVLITWQRWPGNAPAIADVQLTEAFDFRKAIDRDLELIDGCDAIYLLKGWEHSLGARIELDRAFVLGHQVLLEGGAATPAEIIRTRGTVLTGIRHLDFEAPLEPGPHPDDVAFATDRDERPWEPLPLNHFTYLGDDDPVVIPETQRLLSEDSVLESINAQIRAANGEVRVVDPETGGEKGSKLARFDLIPHEALEALAEHFGRGAEKYADRNWERGYDWALTFAALNRHLWAWWGGEDVDPETGSNHMTAVAWHAFVAFTFQERGLGTDSRVVTA